MAHRVAGRRLSMMPWRLAYWPVRMRGAVGRAERRGVERVLEHRAFVRQAIDVRRLE
jgi:hypothetical protein